MTRRIFTTLSIALALTWGAVTQGGGATRDEAVAGMGVHDGADISASRRADYFFLEAMAQRQQGNSTGAYELLRHCIEIRPDAAEAYYFMAQYYLTLNDLNTTQQLFKEAADLRPDNVTYMETLARAYASAGRYAEAITSFERLMSTDYSRDDILELLVQLYVAQADYGSAIGAIGRLEEVNGMSDEYALAKYDIYMQHRDSAAAIGEIKKLVDKYPNDPVYMNLYADVLLENKKDSAAYDIYTRLLAEDKDDSRALFSIRTYYRQKGEQARADSVTAALLTNDNTDTDIRAYVMGQEIKDSETAGGDSTKVLRLFNAMNDMPEKDIDMMMMCVMYMRLKDMPDDSIATVLRKALDASPDNASARLQLVSMAYRQEDYDSVIALCSAARQYNPEEMAFYYYQGVAYMQKEDGESALGAFQNGISVINEESDPDIVSDFYSLMGQLLSEKGDMDAAFAAYDSCLQWKGDNIEAMNNYAYFLSLEGRELAKAEQMSRTTLKAEPQNPTYLDTYAWILFMQERYAEAKIYIDQAVLYDSTANAVITEHAGDIYAMNGETDAAVRYWIHALAEEPDNKALIRKIKKKKYIK